MKVLELGIARLRIRPTLSSTLFLRSPFARSSSSNAVPRTALFFPGQGTQKPAMLAPLLTAFPATITPLLDLLDSTIHSTPPLSSILASGPAPALTATENAQPIILLTSIAILRVMETDFGLLPTQAGVSYYLGHSLGEFTALVAAGILSLPDALQLVRKRGLAMAAAARAVSNPELEGGPGEVGMVALVVGEADLPTLIAGVRAFIDSESLPDDEFLSIGNVNSRTQIVLSGHLKAIRGCVEQLKRFGGRDPRAIRLNVTAPFHSPVMAPAVRVVAEMLEGMKLDFEGRRGEVVSNVTGEAYSTEREIREVLPRQCTETVQWAKGVRWLDQEMGVERWVGTGPGKVGMGLVGREVRQSRGVRSVEGTDVNEIEEVVKELMG